MIFPGELFFVSMQTFGRYQLVKKLASGGMGQVFLARQKGLVGFEKLVVVKRLLPHLSEEEELIDMFFDEARIAAALNHPNIVQIYDLGEVDGTYYIAMEYVQGGSFREINQRASSIGSQVPLALKCRVIADAAGALDFAHRAKGPQGQPLTLIHRDVSPQNILVGFNGSVKLIDFGVAKVAGKISTTLTGAIKGKYAYMSPEQARGEELDRRSDIFGLGIVFYEALTGTRLFKRDSEPATLRAVVGTKVLPPSSLARAIPKQIDAIVLKALAKDRKDRFQSAGEMQLAIEEFLVRQRLPATAAHLSAFMRRLYEEEVTELGNEQRLLGPERAESKGSGRSHREASSRSGSKDRSGKSTSVKQ
jgi:eukaryotic-like serine/threonine-protein kinase